MFYRDDQENLKTAKRLDGMKTQGNRAVWHSRMEFIILVKEEKLMNVESSQKWRLGMIYPGRNGIL